MGDRQQRPRLGDVDSDGRSRGLDGCPDLGGVWTGSRRSRGPKARVTLRSVDQGGVAVVGERLVEVAWPLMVSRASSDVVTERRLQNGITTPSPRSSSERRVEGLVGPRRSACSPRHLILLSAVFGRHSPGPLNDRCVALSLQVCSTPGDEVDLGIQVHRLSSRTRHRPRSGRSPRCPTLGATSLARMRLTARGIPHPAEARSNGPAGLCTSLKCTIYRTSNGRAERLWGGCCRTFGGV